MKVPVLMYHKVAPGKREKYRISPEKFASQMEYLSGKGYQTISPDELLRFIKGTRNERRKTKDERQRTRDEGRGTSSSMIPRPLRGGFASLRTPSSVIRVRRGILPQRPVLLTFDDGHKDNFIYAYPILKRYKFQATVFPVTQYIGKRNGWSDGKEEILSWGEIIEMRKEGFSFGSHTQTHPNLLELPQDKVLSEIRDSKRILEERLGKPIRFFAYPYGKFNSQIKDMVKEVGYLGAFSTLPGKNGIDDDPFLLRRILIRGYDTKFHFILNLKLGRSRI